MAASEAHLVVIEHRGVAYRARCRCGWTSHPWNDVRPAEADAWEHTYGDSRLIEGRPPRTEEPVEQIFAAVGAPQAPAPVEKVVDRARQLAGGSAPRDPSALHELVELAGRSPATLSEARDATIELLRRHSRRNAGTADSEWLQLHTARRLLEAALTEAEG
ncbi:MAG TPA: hypothetical protein VE990_13090 [Acidimicrobiales bacterium]|nr:hypothetical protein [Acidimicrobiales bacterium]